MHLPGTCKYAVLYFIILVCIKVSPEKREMMDFLVEMVWTEIPARKELMAFLEHQD